MRNTEKNRTERERTEIGVVKIGATLKFASRPKDGAAWSDLYLSTCLTWVSLRGALHPRQHSFQCPIPPPRKGAAHGGVEGFEVHAIDNQLYL